MPAHRTPEMPRTRWPRCNTLQLLMKAYSGRTLVPGTIYSIQCKLTDSKRTKFFELTNLSSFPDTGSHWCLTGGRAFCLCLGNLLGVPHCKCTWSRTPILKTSVVLQFMISFRLACICMLQDTGTAPATINARLVSPFWVANARFCKAVTPFCPCRRKQGAALRSMAGVALQGLTCSSCLAGGLQLSLWNTRRLTTASRYFLDARTRKDSIMTGATWHCLSIAYTCKIVQIWADDTVCAHVPFYQHETRTWMS